MTITHRSLYLNRDCQQELNFSFFFFFEVLFTEHQKQIFLCGGDDKEEGVSIHELGELNDKKNELNFNFSFDFVEITTIEIKAKIDPYRKFFLELISRYGEENSQLKTDFAVCTSG